ncbi:MAG: phosphoribosylglycinamide formyltransferase [Planctomycetota bacterium]
MSQPTPSIQPLRVGVLLSGGGRTLENLADYLKDHPGLAEVVLVISDRPTAFGLERARRLGIPALVMPCRNQEDSLKIFQALDDASVQVALLAGFLRLLHVPNSWQGRMLNIHPSLIPKFCGEGYYGDRVHRAVLEAKEQMSGCTVHFVDNSYDHGPILLQERVPVFPQDTPEILAQRVFEAERRLYPRAVRAMALGLVTWVGGKPYVVSEEEQR